MIDFMIDIMIDIYDSLWYFEMKWDLFNKRGIQSSCVWRRHLLLGSSCNSRFSLMIPSDMNLISLWIWNPSDSKTKNWNQRNGKSLSLAWTVWHPLTATFLLKQDVKKGMNSPAKDYDSHKSPLSCQKFWESISFSEHQSDQEPLLLQELPYSSSDQPPIDTWGTGVVMESTQLAQRQRNQINQLLASDSTRDPSSFKRNIYVFSMGKT